MTEHQCHKCGNTLRPNAKFCPRCGAKTGETANSMGIFSFDDFFSEEDEHKKEIKDALEKAASKPSEPKPEPVPEPEKVTEPVQKESSDLKSPKGIFTFRDRDREKRNKVKILDDTLELPIEEIQREIERRREKERYDNRPDAEKEAGKKHMAGLFENLKESQKGDVLIPEDEILTKDDLPEKQSLLGKAKRFLLGTDAPDIEGVDVKEGEEAEGEKVRRVRQEKSKEEKKTGWRAILGIQEEEPASEEPAAIEEKPAEETLPPLQEETIEAPVFVSIAKEEKMVDSVETDEPDLDTDEFEEPQPELTWFQRIFGVKQEDEEARPEEEPVVVASDAVEEEVVSEETPKPPKEKMPTKKKLMYGGIAAAILLAIGIGLFYTGDYMTNPLRLSENFATALEEDDMDKIAGMLHADGASVTAKTLEPFKSLLNDPEYKANLLASLSAFDETAGRTPDADVWIEETGSQYWLFNSYSMKIKTFSINPLVTYPNTKVSVDGAEPIDVSPEKPISITALLPGPHNITSSYTEGLTPLNASADVTLTTTNKSLKDGMLVTDLKNVGKFATFTSPQEEANVMINGEDKGKVKDMAAGGFKFGPFDTPVKVQLKLDTPLGSVLTETVEAKDDGQAIAFTFPNMVEISEYHDEATIYINGENKGVLGKALIPFHRMIGPVKPEDTIQLEMMQEGKLTKSNVLTVGDNEKLLFSYSKPFTFSWGYSNAIVILDGVNTGKTVYDLAGDDMIADILNSYETISISKKFPWGTFESDTLSLAEAGTLDFTINSMNDTLIRQLQSAVVKYLEEDAYAISNLKPDNYSNITDPLLSERRSYIQKLVDENHRIVRVSDKAHFDMNSIQFDDEDGDYYARITEQYVYHFQEYQGGIFRPIRLEMTEARENIQHAMRYDANRGEWVIYENRPKDSIGENTEAIDLAY